MYAIHLKFWKISIIFPFKIKFWKKWTYLKGGKTLFSEPQCMAGKAPFHPAIMAGTLQLGCICLPSWIPSQPLHLFPTARVLLSSCQPAHLVTINKGLGKRRKLATQWQVHLVHVLLNQNSIANLKPTEPEFTAKLGGVCFEPLTILKISISVVSMGMRIHQPFSETRRPLFLFYFYLLFLNIFLISPLPSGNH